jgi:predicted dehydrogenase
MSICELNPQLRETIGQRYHVEHAFAGFEEALRARPHAAVICTPAHWHIPMARAAVEAGVHVLIEKPLSTKLDGIDELRRESAARGLTVAVAYVLRNNPALAAMREAIASGRFGAPKQVVAVLGQHLPKHRPAYRQIYFADHATGGGAVQDFLTHAINAVEWLVGPITRLTADLDHQVLDGVTVEDTVHVLTRHGQVMGCFTDNLYQPALEDTLTVVCERGMARFAVSESRWRWMTEADGAWQDGGVKPVDRDATFVAQAHAFLDAIDGLGRPVCTLEEACQSLRVNLAILASSKERAWQMIEEPQTVHA